MTDRTNAICRYVAARTPAHRDAVIAAHLYLCKRGARKFRRPESDPADLEQVAALGLVKATDTYRAERATPFEAYAWMSIVGELMHYVRDSERAVRLPRDVRALERRYVAAWERLAALNGAEPGAYELAAALEVPLAAVHGLQAMRRSQRDDDERQNVERLAMRECALPLDERVTVLIALESLDERERAIVFGTYGSGLSQAEIALRLRLSQSQISKIHTRALGKLSAKVA